VRFANKVAFVTGAASGIGLATARCFAHEGARLVVADIDASALRTAVNELPDALPLTVDVSRVDEVEARLRRRTLDHGSHAARRRGLRSSLTHAD
jgi:NAD(P)-dependent dehydrogenase (short-subunit alcohol dehydrogenase family)